MAEVRAGSSSKLTVTITDADGVAVPAASIATITLSLIDIDTDAYVGLWENRNVKGVNGGALSDGVATIDIPAADNAMVSANASERRMAVVKWTTADEAGSASLTFSMVRVPA